MPPELRRQVWLALSGATQRRQRHPPHYYASSALQGASSPLAHQIELVSRQGDRQAGGQQGYGRGCSMLGLPRIGYDGAASVASCKLTEQRQLVAFPPSPPPEATSAALQDVPRTFPNNEWVQSEAGQAAVRHVLLACAHHNPRVGS